MMKKIFLFTILIICIYSCRAVQTKIFQKEITLEKHYQDLLQQNKIGINPVIILPNRQAKKYSDLTSYEKHISFIPYFSFIEKGVKHLDDYTSEGSINGIIMTNNAPCCGGGRRHKNVFIINNTKTASFNLSETIGKNKSVRFYAKIYCRRKVNL